MIIVKLITRYHQSTGKILNSLVKQSNKNQSRLFSNSSRYLVQSTTNRKDQYQLTSITKNITFRESLVNAQANSTEASSIRQNESKSYLLPGEKSDIALKGENYDGARKLVVLMSWLEAKEKHIEKYRQFYLSRGFDVINVKTSLFDIMLPARGANKHSRDFVKFLLEKEYSNVILHGFSVGSYMFGQLLFDIKRQEKDSREKLLGSIRGVIFDSFCPYEGLCVGLANGITSNELGGKLIEHLISVYAKVSHNIAIKYYLRASDVVCGGPLKCPSLFLMSREDKIADHKVVERRVIDVWINLGLESQRVLFDTGPHVQLFNTHHNVYVEKVETFLKHVKVF